MGDLDVSGILAAALAGSSPAKPKTVKKRRIGDKGVTTMVSPMKGGRGSSVKNPLELSSDEDGKSDGDDPGTSSAFVRMVVHHLQKEIMVVLLQILKCNEH